VAANSVRTRASRLRNRFWNLIHSPDAIPSSGFRLFERTVVPPIR
jgi:hypothetical protein